MESSQRATRKPSESLQRASGEFQGAVREYPFVRVCRSGRLGRLLGCSQLAPERQHRQQRAARSPVGIDGRCQ
eukprot:10072588-Alexandrium_andersonii.AAC.1